MTEASAPARKALLALWTLVALAGLIGAAAAFRARWGQRAAPPVLATLPPFTLQERTGQPLTAADLAGRPYVADFIFTRCAGSCPAMTRRLARLRPRLPDAVRFVSFSVDPAHDTPEVLRQYARAQGAGEGWLFVTGPPRAVHALATDGFKLAAYEVPPAEQKEGGDGPFLHSAKFVLVDQAGRVRGYYDSTEDAALFALERDAAALLAGAP